MNQKGIGVSNLPNVKYRSVCKSGIDFNIMTVGSHGIGKTSFINGLLGSKVVTEIEEARQVCKSMTIQVSHFTIKENEFNTRITVTEVDRVGDFTDNNECWVPIIKIINDNYQDFLYSEHKSVRSLIRDKRIHVCFYCLEPLDNFIRPTDIISMEQISKYCNLIPIVCKSDYLNEYQIQKSFDFLRRKLEEHNVVIFEDQNPTRGNITNFTPPFFVTSPKITENGISYVREYPWGQLNLQNMHSNDLFRLREMLVNQNILHLIETTEEYYDRFRACVLAYNINKQSNKALTQDILNFEVFDKLKSEENTIRELKERIEKKKREYDDQIKSSLSVENVSNK